MLLMRKAACLPKTQSPKLLTEACYIPTRFPLSPCLSFKTIVLVKTENYHYYSWLKHIKLGNGKGRAKRSGVGKILQVLGETIPQEPFRICFSTHRHTRPQHYIFYLISSVYTYSQSLTPVFPVCPPPCYSAHTPYMYKSSKSHPPSTIISSVCVCVASRAARWQEPSGFN